MEMQGIDKRQTKEKNPSRNNTRLNRREGVLLMLKKEAMTEVKNK